jgi:hypothetical protein
MGDLHIVRRECYGAAMTCSTPNIRCATNRFSEQKSECTEPFRHLKLHGSDPRVHSSRVRLMLRPEDDGKFRAGSSCGERPARAVFACHGPGGAGEFNSPTRRRSRSQPVREIDPEPAQALARNEVRS